MTCKWPACTCKATGVKCKNFKGKDVQKAESNKKDSASLKEKDFKFYSEIWAERPHFCSNPKCNKFLGDELRTYFFDHILEKGSSLYKHLRHEKQNICILCIDCHTRKAYIPYLIELRIKTLRFFNLNN